MRSSCKNTAAVEKDFACVLCNWRELFGHECCMVHLLITRWFESKCTWLVNSTNHTKTGFEFKSVIQSQHLTENLITSIIDKQLREETNVVLLYFIRCTWMDFWLKLFIVKYKTCLQWLIKSDTGIFDNKYFTEHSLRENIETDWVSLLFDKKYRWNESS